MSSLNGEVILCDQRVGEARQLKFFGDEFYARCETVEGYTVIYDTQQHCYCYAQLAVGRFVSSGVPLHKRPPRSLRKHLKEAPEIRNQKFSLRHSRIRPNEEGEALSMMRTLGSDGGLLSGRKLHQGEVLGLTVIVDFDDVQTNISAAEVEQMLNADNYSVNGNHCSVKTYFQTVSSGKLQYTNLVVGPIRLSKRRSHYINNLFVQEAMDIVVNDLNVDLTQFDSREEGVVDAINFLYAGESQYAGDLWPHNSVQSLHYDNLRTHYYQLTGLGLHSVDLRIGTICHENSHLLCRFPDMYDYGQRDGDHEASQGIGRYCLMGSGNHLNDRRTPAPVCGYLRELAGWVDTVIDLNSQGSYVAAAGRYNAVMKYSTDKINEYFIVENRSRMGLDSHLPSSGLAVLHCDTLGSNEWQQGTRNNHYQCALLQADGHLDLENNRNAGDTADLFSGAQGIALSDQTVPSSREWDGSDSGFYIRDVTPAGEVIQFSVGLTSAPRTVHAETSPNTVIPDNDMAGISSTLAISSAGDISAMTISVEIIHSWISDLTVSLRAPNDTHIVLHDREGDDGDDIFQSWSSDNVDALESVKGLPASGDWVLHIVDNESADVGRLLRWSIDMDLTAARGGVVETKVEPKQLIPDDNSQGISSILTQTRAGEVKNLTVSVNVTHSYIGDLEVELVSPSGMSVLLHDREGEWRNDINRSYDSISTPALARFVGVSIAGDWQLRVRDFARSDVGRLDAWGLKILY